MKMQTLSTFGRTDQLVAGGLNRRAFPLTTMRSIRGIRRRTRDRVPNETQGAQMSVPPVAYLIYCPPVGSDVKRFTLLLHYLGKMRFYKE